MKSILLLLCLLAPALAAGVPSTDLIRKAVDLDEGPLEALSQESVVPEWRRPTEHVGGEPGLQRLLVQEVPLPIRDAGSPGELSQIRGMGMSAEDTNVQVFGIPLNYAQGGGFDFSIFPSYLWSDLRFRLGGNPLSLDPRGVAGTLSLTPWTLRALQARERQTEVGAQYSGHEVGQAWAAYSSPGQAAVVAGFATGKLRGPSGVFSWRILDTQGWRVSAHLLATSVTADVEGSRSFPTPLAVQLSTRIIPFVEAARGEFRLAAFADFTHIRYDDPAPPFPTHTDAHATQGGFQASYTPRDASGNWNLGLGERGVHYETLAFLAPDEWITNLSVGRLQYLDSSKLWSIDPAISLLHVSRFGLLPQPSLGIRRDLLEGELAVFAKGSLSQRVPSMADRFYDDAAFQIFGNRDLAVERDWSLNMGFDLKRATHSLRLEGIAQLREDVQVFVTNPNTFDSRKENRGLAKVFVAQASDDWQPLPILHLRGALAATHSELEHSGLPIPYLPTLTWTQSIGWRPLGSPALELGLKLRTATRAAYTTTTRAELPGYGLLDVTLESEVPRTKLHAAVGIENIFDRPVELYRDYPQRRIVTGTLRLAL